MDPSILGPREGTNKGLSVPVFLAVLALASLAACSRQEEETGKLRSTDKAAHSLGAEGGVLETVGARVEFLPGSLSGEQTAEIKPIEPPSTLIEKNQVLVSPVYEIRTEEVYFRKPANVRLSVDRTKLPQDVDITKVYPVLMQGGACERIRPYHVDPEKGEVEFALQRTFALVNTCSGLVDDKTGGLVLAADGGNTVELVWGSGGDWKKIDVVCGSPDPVFVDTLHHLLIEVRESLLKPPLLFESPDPPLTIWIKPLVEQLDGTASGGNTLTLNSRQFGYNERSSLSSIQALLRHEYFHLVHQGYLVRFEFIKNFSLIPAYYGHRWMDEATATWMASRLAPSWPGPGTVCRVPDLSFGYRGLASFEWFFPEDDREKHQYLSSIFFHYLAEERRDVEKIVRGFYENLLSEFNLSTLELLDRIITAGSGRNGLDHPLRELYCQFLIRLYWRKNFWPMNDPHLNDWVRKEFGDPNEIKIPKDHWEVWLFPDPTILNRYRRESGTYSGAPYSIVQAITLSNKTFRPGGEDGLWSLNLKLETEKAPEDVRMIVFPNKGSGWTEPLVADARKPLVLPDWQEHQHATVWLVDVSANGSTPMKLKAELTPKAESPKPVIRIRELDDKTNLLTLSSEGNGALKLALQLALAGQEGGLEGVHFVAVADGRTRHGWSGRREGDRQYEEPGMAYMEWLPKFGERVVRIQAEGPGGVKTERTIKVRYDPADWQQKVARASVFPEEVVRQNWSWSPDEIAKRLQAARELKANMDRVLAKPENRDNLACRIEAKGAEEQIEYLTRRLPEEFQAQTTLATLRIAQDSTDAHLYDRSLALYRQYFERLSLDTDREIAWEETTRKTLPGQYGLADPMNANREVESIAREKRRKLLDNRVYYLDWYLNVAASYEDFEATAWGVGSLLEDCQTQSAAVIEEMRKERRSPEDIRHQEKQLIWKMSKLYGILAEATVFCKGDRTRAAELWMRSLFTAASASNNPQKDLEEKLEGCLMSWWPEGTPRVRFADPLQPAELKALLPSEPRPEPRANRSAVADPPVPDAAKSVPARNEGDQAYAQGDLATALNKYTLALKYDAENYGAYVGRGNVYNDQGQGDRAIADYREALKRPPLLFDESAERVRFKLAELLIVAGKLEEADLEIRALEKTGRPEPWVLTLRGQYHLKQGNREEAARCFAAAKRDNPKEGERNYKQAGQMTYLKQFERALLLYDTCELMDPGTAAIWFGRGEALAGLARKREAVAAYRCYLEFDARSEWAQKARQAIEALER